jgi:hypothetical protein
MISLQVATALVLAGVFSVAGFVQLQGPGFVRRSYQRWDFPPRFYRVAGALELAAGCFLATANTRIWGIALAAMIAYISVAMHLARGQYAWVLPGLLVMAALPTALLTAAV